MEGENSSDSDCELVIDETVIVSSGDEDCVAVENDIEAVNEKLLDAVTARVNSENDPWSTNGLYKNLFHPESISSADMRDELYNEETNTCTICNETFKYNVGLICHIEMEHKEDMSNHPKKRKIKSKKIRKVKKIVPFDSSNNEMNGDGEKEILKKVSSKALSDNVSQLPISTLKKSCEVCKKSFSEPSKLSKHVENCVKIGLKFHCVFCKSKFGWESKYKKHLFRTHKLNAAVICKLCSAVFSDVENLAEHSSQCSESNKRSLKKTAATTVNTAATNTSPKSTNFSPTAEISI